MRILQVTPCYLPGRRYGGPIASVHGMSRALVQRGHEVEVFTTDRDGWLPLEPAPPESATIDGVEVGYYPTGFGKRLHRAPEMAEALLRRLRDFDVVHLHGLFTWPTFAAARAAERRRVPYILSPRGMLVRDLVRRRGRGRKSLWIRAVDRRTVERATLIHTTSELEDADLRAFGLDVGWTTTIPNGVDPDPFDGDWSTVSPRIRALAEHDDLVLFLGRLSWKKRLEPVIDALADLDRGHLVLAGPDDGARSALRRRVSRRGLSSRTSFVGPVTGQDKRALLHAAATLVLNSHNENFGNVVLEAMSAATPVVVADTIGAAALVESNDCGLVTDGTPDDLAEVFHELLSDADLRHTLGQAGQLAADERFSWPALAARFEAMYSEIAGLRRLAA